jgi:hypothetical protein
MYSHPLPKSPSRDELRANGSATGIRSAMYTFEACINRRVADITDKLRESLSN